MRRSIAGVLFIFFMFVMESACLGDEYEPGRERKGPLFGGPYSLQVISGVLVSPVLQGHRPDLDFVQANVRLGWLIQPEKKTGAEIILDLTNSRIINGAGNYMGGFALLLRYNFDLLLERARPFVHAGAGIIYNDVYKDQSQSLIGQAIEFTLRGGAGFNFKIHRSWSLDVEGAFEHISNAGMADRNTGANAFGGMLGLTYYFSGM